MRRGRKASTSSGPSIRPACHARRSRCPATCQFEVVHPPSSPRRCPSFGASTPLRTPPPPLSDPLKQCQFPLVVASCCLGLPLVEACHVSLTAPLMPHQPMPIAETARLIDANEHDDQDADEHQRSDGLRNRERLLDPIGHQHFWFPQRGQNTDAHRQERAQTRRHHDVCQVFGAGLSGVNCPGQAIKAGFKAAEAIALENLACRRELPLPTSVEACVFFRAAVGFRPCGA